MIQEEIKLSFINVIIIYVEKPKESKIKVLEVIISMYTLSNDKKLITSLCINNEQ